MKKRVNSISQILVVVFFTLMIVIDFFPNIGINKAIGIIGVVTFLALGVITRQKGERVFNSSKQEFIFTLFLGIYILSILVILTLLGGVSQVGIGLTNPLLWGLYLIGVLVSFNNYKKELKSRNGSHPF
jgi:hypothetical protein